MEISFELPETSVMKPCITVIGVGGAGGNAVNNMIASNLEGANFIVANTDAQAVENSRSNRRIQLGTSLTKGLGAGASPDTGRAAAEESVHEINEFIQNSNMVFITAGMGGGTGTGAAPVIARMAKEQGILTVGIVTKPFHFEGAHRMRVAEKGLVELQKYVDTLLVIPNQNLFRIANERTTLPDAFKMADEVLHAGVRGITDLITMPGLINLDFADIVTIMSKMGKAMMGTGEATGENRALQAAESAISNPLLDSCSMKGARGVLINITGGMDMTLFEVDEAANRIRQEVDDETDIIFGSTFNESLEGTIRVSLIATGIDSNDNKYTTNNNSTNKPVTKTYMPPKFEETAPQEPSYAQSHVSEKQYETLENMSSAPSKDEFEQSEPFFDREESHADLHSATENNEITDNANEYHSDFSINKQNNNFPSSNFVFDEEEKPVSRSEKSPKKPFSFFGMLKGNKNDEENDDINSSEKNGDEISEKNLDIPAFLRRKQ